MASLAAGRPAVLTLFGYDWDAVAAAELAQRYRLLSAGFDLFAFPQNARLLWFDIDAWVARLASRHRGQLAGVISHNEQFGALAAALLAERLGLPGTSPDAILRCQHKLAMRELLETVAPEANLPFFVLPFDYGEAPPDNLSYPLFVKPVKAAYSVLARRVENRAELAALTRFGRFETWIIRRLVKPFDDVAARRVRFTVDANHMLAEQPFTAAQFNLDGYVIDGELRPLGVVDSIMYPGTQAFLRFEYPSRLPLAVQRRAQDVADRFLRAAGFQRGFFNMEFFYDAATDALKVIEFNPRLASQLADLYERVTGRDVHAMAIALACGEDPEAVARRPVRGGAAASFVFRSFDDQPVRDASAQGLAWLKTAHPDALLLRFARQGASLARELKWLGSHRYAVLHLHGDDPADLYRRFTIACAQLGWPAVI